MLEKRPSLGLGPVSLGWYPRKWGMSPWQTVEIWVSMARALTSAHLKAFSHGCWFYRQQGGWISMRWKIVAFLLTALSIVSQPVFAVNERDFLVQTTGDLMNLCTVSENDPLKEEAIHFCHGYLVGAYHYYKASTTGPGERQLVCLPEPPPSREKAISMFIEWAKAHPQYKDELPVDTEFRFLMETWPCK